MAIENKFKYRINTASNSKSFPKLEPSYGVKVCDTSKKTLSNTQSLSKTSIKCTDEITDSNI